MLKPGSTKCRHVWSTELVSKELAATEEAKKRRRVEDSAAHELQKAKEEAARLAGRLKKARDSEIVLLSLGKSLSWVAADLVTVSELRSTSRVFLSSRPGSGLIRAVSSVGAYMCTPSQQGAQKQFRARLAVLIQVGLRAMQHWRRDLRVWEPLFGRFGIRSGLCSEFLGSTARVLGLIHGCDSVQVMGEKPRPMAKVLLAPLCQADYLR